MTATFWLVFAACVVAIGASIGATACYRLGLASRRTEAMVYLVAAVTTLCAGVWGIVASL